MEQKPEAKKPKVDFNIADKKLLVDQEVIKESFISTLVKIHKKSEADAEMIYEKETLYYKKALAANAWLAECTGITLYSAFLEIAITGLSIQSGGKAEAYLEARNAKIGTENGKDVWGKVASLCITAYGELNMRIMAGQIVRINNPIVVYEGDHFQPRTNDQGVLMVEYTPKIPRQSKNIIACYVCIVLPKGGYDFKWMLQDDIDRLKEYSKNAALYSSNDGQIDPGFLEAKTIKHAFRGYTKLRVGDSVSFEEETEEVESKTFAPRNDTTTAPATQATAEKKDEDEYEIF